MSVARLPSGRWRAQVYDPVTGKNLSVSHILGGPGTFATKTEAKQARVKARERLGSLRERDLTVRGFWERWTSDPLFARPKESSDIRRRELTKGFVERYGEVPIFQVGDEIVAEWLAGGKRAGSVMGLSSMFADAASMKAGRLIDRNPFEKLGISRGKGRRDQQPPTEQEAWEIIACARRLSCPSFAAWLQVAAFTGMRPGGAGCVAVGAGGLRARADRGGGAVQRRDPEVRHAEEPSASRGAVDRSRPDGS